MMRWWYRKAAHYDGICTKFQVQLRKSENGLTRAVIHGLFILIETLDPTPCFSKQLWSQGSAGWQEKYAKAVSVLTFWPQLSPSASGRKRPFWANSNMIVLVFSPDDFLGDLFWVSCQVHEGQGVGGRLTLVEWLFCARCCWTSRKMPCGPLATVGTERRLHSYI